MTETAGKGEAAPVNNDTSNNSTTTSTDSTTHSTNTVTTDNSTSTSTDSTLTTNTNTENSPSNTVDVTPSTPVAPPPSYVKLAMRNMVRKGRQSLLHFGLTALGFAGVLLLLAWFARPSLPGA